MTESTPIPTPSQAEGEREPDAGGADIPRTTPSQAEGEDEPEPDSDSGTD
ncbi:hypothetical protein AB0M11_37590 [Streptomyces sp. NPDC051987]